MTLSGGGVIATSDFGNGGTIKGLGSSDSLTNLSNTIEVNHWTLTIDTGGAPVLNNGTLAAFGGSMVVDSPVTGTGNVLLDGGNATFAASVSGQTVGFDSSGHLIDQLILNHAESFSGTVAGMSSPSRTLFDSIDLADFKASTTSIMGVSGSSAKGGITNVTLEDSSSGLMTTLHLLNQYANEFAVTTSAYSLTAATPGSASSGTLFSVDHTLGTPNHGVGHA